MGRGCFDRCSPAKVSGALSPGKHLAGLALFGKHTVIGGDFLAGFRLDGLGFFDLSGREKMGFCHIGVFLGGLHLVAVGVLAGAFGVAPQAHNKGSFLAGLDLVAHAAPFLVGVEREPPAGFQESGGRISGEKAGTNRGVVDNLFVCHGVSSIRFLVVAAGVAAVRLLCLYHTLRRVESQHSGVKIGGLHKTRRSEL